MADEIPGAATAAYVIKKPNRAESRASAASLSLSLSPIVNTENDIVESDTHERLLSPTYSL